MKINESNHNDILVFTVQGRADSDGVFVLDDVLMEALNRQYYKIILDLSQLEYINSSGMRVLAEVLNAVQKEDGDLYLTTPPERVRRVFEIIGFDNFFQMYPSVEEALGHF